MEKILTIIICLTASLSFAHSTILDKTNDDAFTYDYSQVCEQLCFHFTLDTAYDSYGLTNPLVDPFDFTFHFSSEVDPDIERIKHIIRKLKSKTKYGFSSVADANAYFNIQILNNTPNNQLGYLRWLTYEFSDSIKSYMINFGATTTEHLAPPLFPLYKTPNDTTNNTFTYKYLWLCNDVINCQFIKLSDMCDTSPKPQTPLRFPYGSYYSPEKINHDCEIFLSFQRALPGFSSEADASINIQLFDSPVLLKDKQNYPSNIKHDF